MTSVIGYNFVRGPLGLPNSISCKIDNLNVTYGWTEPIVVLNTGLRLCYQSASVGFEGVNFEAD